MPDLVLHHIDPRGGRHYTCPSHPGMTIPEIGYCSPCKSANGPAGTKVGQEQP